MIKVFGGGPKWWINYFPSCTIHLPLYLYGSCVFKVPTIFWPVWFKLKTQIDTVPLLSFIFIFPSCRWQKVYIHERWKVNITPSNGWHALSRVVLLSLIMLSSVVSSLFSWAVASVVWQAVLELSIKI